MRRVKPLDLIATAKRLVDERSSRRPRQADLKRAVSTAYYAMFHYLCRTCADCIVGTKAADRSEPAWSQVYRSRDHGHAKRQCAHRRIEAFPKQVEDFANQFRMSQTARHEADYDPHRVFRLSEAIEHIESSEQAIRDLRDLPIKDRRAVAVWLILKPR